MLHLYRAMFEQLKLNAWKSFKMQETQIKVRVSSIFRQVLVCSVVKKSIIFQYFSLFHIYDSKVLYKTEVT